MNTEDDGGGGLMTSCSHFCRLSGFSLGLAAIHVPRDYMRDRRIATLSGHMAVFIPKAEVGNWRLVPLITATGCPETGVTSASVSSAIVLHHRPQNTR